MHLEKINKVLGDDFKYNWIFGNTKDKHSVYCFEFINKSKISNNTKSKFICEKIQQLITNGYFEVEDLKISGRGRFLVITIKSIEDYKYDKIILEQQFIENIKNIDIKINYLKNN